MRLLITGASGQLGAYLLNEACRRDLDLIAWSGRPTSPRSGYTLRPVNLLSPAEIVANLEEYSPDVVLHAAAISAADQVRRDPNMARAVNVDATAQISEWCRKFDRRMVYTSTDLVFDGTRAPYKEDAPTRPILEYGRTKESGERALRGRGLIVRLSLLYGATKCGRNGFFDNAIEAVRRGESPSFFEDEFRTPLDYHTAATALLDLAIGGREGIVHLGGSERVSRYNLMRRAIAASGLPQERVQANRRTDVSLPEPRPADVSFDTTRLQNWLPHHVRPSIEEALSQA